MDTHKTKSSSTMPRRQFLAASIAGLVGAGALRADNTIPSYKNKIIKNGRIKQSVSKWTYTAINTKMSLDELCIAAKTMGIESVELVSHDELATVKKHGLVCAVGVPTHYDVSIVNNKDHAESIASYIEAIDAAAAVGTPSVVCIPGNREPGLSDEEALENGAKTIEQIIPHAEKKRVRVGIEIISHKDKSRKTGPVFDNMLWGVQLCDRVGSDYLKIVYDIYHAQRMEGDVIHTLQTYKDYITHYHTGGSPGRHEINDTQELNYPAIIKAILDTGYTGYVGHEFRPTRDEPLESLAEAVQICDVA